MMDHDVLMRLCSILPLETALHRLFLNICELGFLKGADVSGLGEAQRSIITQAIRWFQVRLREAVLHPRQRLDIKIIDLLHSLVLQHMCKRCSRTFETSTAIFGLCPACKDCSQTRFTRNNKRDPDIFVHRCIADDSAEMLTSLARAEIMTNRLYRGMRIFEKILEHDPWTDLDSGLFDFGPRFARHCVALLFDGGRLSKAKSTRYITSGATSYDFFRVKWSVVVLQSALRDCDERSSQSHGCSNANTTGEACAVAANRIDEVLDAVSQLSCNRQVVSSIQKLICAVADKDAVFLHAAFTMPMIRVKTSEQTVDESLFAAAKRLQLPPLRAVANVLASCVQHMLNKQHADVIHGFRFAALDTHFSFTCALPPSLQMSRSHDGHDRIRKTTGNMQRVVHGMMRSEGAYNVSDDFMFQYALAAAAIASDVGDASARCNGQLQRLLVQSITTDKQWHEISWRKIECALFVVGPLHTFSSCSLRWTISEPWKEDQREILDLTDSIRRRALIHVLNMSETFDAINLSRPDASLFVTRVLHTLEIFGEAIYGANGPHMPWDLVCDALIMRKRKGEPF